jgi:hypothetical protein
VASFDGDKAQMDVIEARNRVRTFRAKPDRRPAPDRVNMASGHYFFNGNDISDENLDRGWYLMASELERMVEEAKAVRAKVEEREADRERNFADSGGRDAFTDDELFRHAQEGERLTKHRRRANMVISELEHRTMMMRTAWKLSTNAPV